VASEIDRVNSFQFNRVQKKQSTESYLGGNAQKADRIAQKYIPLMTPRHLYREVDVVPSPTNFRSSVPSFGANKQNFAFQHYDFIKHAPRIVHSFLQLTGADARLLSGALFAIRTALF
jgi:hypothetical protein